MLARKEQLRILDAMRNRVVRQFKPPAPDRAKSVLIPRAQALGPRKWLVSVEDIFGNTVLSRHVTGTAEQVDAMIPNLKLEAREL